MGNNKDMPRLDYEHHEIHEGDAYVAHNEESTMADNETINFAFKTPASTTNIIHMIIEVFTRAGCEIEILEGATWTAQSGTAFTPINRNRNSSNTSSLKGNETTTVFTAGEIAYDVTTILTTNATTVDYFHIFGANKDTSAYRGAREFLLKSDTTYVIRATADGGSNGINLQMHWYEELANVV